MYINWSQRRVSSINSAFAVYDLKRPVCLVRRVVLIIYDGIALLGV